MKKSIVCDRCKKRAVHRVILSDGQVDFSGLVCESHLDISLKKFRKESDILTMEIGKL